MCEKFCGIYCITNMIDNRKYVGMSRDIKRRWIEHKCDLNNNKHDNSYLQRAWNKYGENNFSFEIIELCAEEMLSSRECYYIRFLKTLSHENGYNLTTGGENTSIGKLVINLDSLEIYTSVKNAAMHANVTQTTMSLWCKNHKKYMYLEEYNSLSLEEQELCRSFDWYSYNHKKLSKAHSSENLSEITISKLKKATSGCNNPRAFKVYCPELDEVFDCAKYATDKYGINRGSIGQCIKGKLKSAGCHPITGEKLTWLKI